MKLLLTTNARLYKTKDGKYWTKVVYGYDFFKRYLSVFEEIKLVAHCEECSIDIVKDMLRVDGPNLSVYTVPFPHGKWQYIKKYFTIMKCLKNCFSDCDCALLRIPDQLAFQVYFFLFAKKIPVGVEVTSDSWEFFSPGSTNSNFRFILRLMWYIQQKFICRTSLGTAYVTRSSLQNRYPPVKANQNRGFTTHYTSAEIEERFFYKPRNYYGKTGCLKIIHVATQLNGNVKGHKELIEAFGTLCNKGYPLELILVGAGQLNQKIKNLIEKFKIGDKIRYTGILATRNILRDELIKADLFVFPSYREGLPRVIIEAMACALPCVASSLPGIAELLDDICLVPKKDSQELVIKIEEFINNPKKMNYLSKRNFEKAHEYNSTAIKSKRDEFYIKLRNVARSEKA